MDIGEILSRAWRIIWKHKILWIFGLLSGCGSSGNYSPNVQYTFQASDFATIPPWTNRFQGWQSAVFIAGFLALILAIILITAFLITIGRVGMVRGTLQADRGSPRLAFSEIFRGSLPFFWRIFGLNLLILLGFILLVMITVIPLAVSLIGIPCLIPLICIFIILGWLVSIWVEMSVNAVVVEDLGITAGLQRGWEVFRANLGSMIAIGLILGVGIAFIGGLIIALPFLVAVFPTLLGALAGAPRGFRGGFTFTLLCLIAYLPVMLVLYSILHSYIRSAWTLTYLRLTSRRAIDEPVSSPVQ